MPRPQSCSIVMQRHGAALRDSRTAHHGQILDYLDYSGEDVEITLVIPKCLNSKIATPVLEAISVSHVSWKQQGSKSL